MRVWQRLHRNGGLAFVREHPLDLFAATAFPNYGDGYSGSMDLNITEDFDQAKSFADHAAHSDCQNPDECAGSWREGQIR